MSRRLLVIVAAAVAALVVAAPALANVHVPKGATVSEIRAVGQDVRVDGRARGPVIVIGGNLTVGPTGEATNIAVIGGSIRTAPGGRLTGDVFQVGGQIPDLNGWRLAATLLGVLLVRTLFVWLIVATAGLLARSPTLDEFAAGIRDAPARTLTAGALASLGATALAVVLALTVVGIPVALMLAGLLLVGVTAALAVGRRTLGAGSRSRLALLWLAIPGLGDALLALALAVGLGGLLRWFGRAGRSEALSLTRP